MTVKIHNVEYVTVAERVTACHADEGFSMLSEELFSIGERHFVRIAIEVKGKQYIGSAESIASADEMVRSDAPPSRQNGQQDAQAGRPSDALSARIKALSARAREVGIDDNVKWASMLRYLDIGKIKGEAEIALIESYLTQEAEKREKTTF